MCRYLSHYICLCLLRKRGFLWDWTPPGLEGLGSPTPPLALCLSLALLLWANPLSTLSSKFEQAPLLQSVTELQMNTEGENRKRQLNISVVQSIYITFKISTV